MEGPYIQKWNLIDFACLVKLLIQAVCGKPAGQLFSKEIFVMDTTRATTTRAVFILILTTLFLFLPIQSSFAQAQSSAEQPFKVCLSEGGIPSDRCFRAQNLGFEFTATPGRRLNDQRLTSASLLVEVNPQDSKMAEMLVDAGVRGEKVEICIINGANICPPEPFEFFVLCITTGMLAGSECPEVFEDMGDRDGLVTAISLRSVQ